MTMTRSYTELSRLTTLEERFDYLQLGGTIGESTFGFDRWMNQQFYRSREWQQARNYVIVRDMGGELGLDDWQIRGNPVVHHLIPLTMDDIENATNNLLDPEFLISCSLRTHNAIHYGDRSLLPQTFVERTPGDTKLW